MLAGEVDDPVRRGEMELAGLRLETHGLELVLADEAVEPPRHQGGEPGILKLPGHDRRAVEESALRGVLQRLRRGGVLSWRLGLSERPDFAGLDRGGQEEREPQVLKSMRAWAVQDAHPEPL
jgi:hypothetical protein